MAGFSRTASGPRRIDARFALPLAVELEDGIVAPGLIGSHANDPDVALAVEMDDAPADLVVDGDAGTVGDPEEAIDERRRRVRDRRRRELAQGGSAGVLRAGGLDPGDGPDMHVAAEDHDLLPGCVRRPEEKRYEVPLLAPEGFVGPLVAKVELSGAASDEVREDGGGMEDRDAGDHEEDRESPPRSGQPGLDVLPLPRAHEGPVLDGAVQTSVPAQVEDEEPGGPVAEGVVLSLVAEGLGVVAVLELPIRRAGRLEDELRLGPEVPLRGAPSILDLVVVPDHQGGQARQDARHRRILPVAPVDGAVSLLQHAEVRR